MKHITKMMRKANDKFDHMRKSAIDIISSIGKGGRTANVQTYNVSELRDIRIMLPYGISSSGLDDMMVQVIIEEKNISIVGTYDTDRPDVNPGEIIIYSKFGSSIKLDKNGDIIINNGGKAIARVDDTVEVNVPGIGTCTGKITSGNNKVKA